MDQRINETKPRGFLALVDRPVHADPAEAKGPASRAPPCPC
jgi:hypothetical protein